MKILIQKTLVAILLCLSYSFSQAQDCVSLSFDTARDGGELVAQVKVDNFENIIVAQFAITYSYQNLELIDFAGNADIDVTPANVFAAVPGFVSFSWSNPSMGQTLPDGSTLFELRFNVLNEVASDFNIDPNFRIEFFNSIFEELCFTTQPLTALESRTLLVGTVYHDLNENCMVDDNDFTLSDWTVIIDNGMSQSYRITDAFGHYRIPLSMGTYTVSIAAKNELWESCTTPQQIIVDTEGEIIENPIVVSPKNSASALEVVVSSSHIEPCTNNLFTIQYKNNGTGVAQSATIDFEFDEHLTYVSNTSSGFSIDGNVITFNLGTIRPGHSGHFQVVMFASCEDLESGQTVCLEANISSSDIVIPPIDWGGAVLATQAFCAEDTIVLEIENIGLSAMTAPLQSIVVEDDVMLEINEIDLEPQEVIRFKHESTGDVYRVFANQEDGYPLSNFTTDFIESCTDDDTESYRFISMFQNDDESPYRDIECHEVVEEVPSFFITAFPAGYREEHLINQNEDIEYTLNFRNTTSDTVFNIIILTQIDESLDMETIVPGPSSHPYTVSVEDERTLRIEFRNIQLPTFETDKFNSAGFIKYRISQNPNVPIGTMIFSSSSILLDRENEEVSNVIDHLVGEEFIEIILSNEELTDETMLTVAPNPATTMVRIELQEDHNHLSYVLYDINGRIVNAANVPSKVFYINRDFIQAGMYILEIKSSSNIIGTKKIVFYD